MDALINFLFAHLNELGTLAIMILIRFLEKKKLKKKSAVEKFELEKTIIELRNRMNGMND
jgi:hypothetical protein